MRRSKSPITGAVAGRSKSSGPVGAGFSRSLKGKAKSARSVVKAGKSRPATGSRLRTARPKRGVAAGRGY